MTVAFRVIVFVALLIAGSGVEPLLPPYQSDVLPLHHRAFVTFVFQAVGMVGIEPTVSCSQHTRAPGALHPAKIS
jgi:hypothetical protein